MAIISNINVQGVNYELEDTQAREQIANLIESGGVYGSRFTKLADGTLICYGWKTVPETSVDVDWGGIAYGYIPFNVTFPHSFSEHPTVHIYVENNNVISLNAKSENDISVEGINELFVTSANQVNIQDMRVYYQAIGRWK